MHLSHCVSSAHAHTYARTHTHTHTVTQRLMQVSILSCQDAPLCETNIDTNDKHKQLGFHGVSMHTSMNSKSQVLQYIKLNTGSCAQKTSHNNNNASTLTMTFTPKL